MGGRLAGWTDGREGRREVDEWVEFDPKNTDLGRNYRIVMISSSVTQATTAPPFPCIPLPHPAWLPCAAEMESS